MSYRVSVTLLIVLVLACPVWCPMAASAGSQRAGEAATHSCCERCQKPAESPGEDREVPSRSDDEPSPTSRQCFCGDAFLDKMEQDVDGAGSGHLAMISLAAAVECDALVPHLLHSEPEPPSWLSGRDRRCLFMSFLC